MARPRFKPNAEHRKMVEAMSGYGMTEEQIAILVGLSGIDPKTLRKYFRQELSRGQAQAMAKLTQTAYQMATVDKNVSMAIFLLKTRGGWRETGNFNPGGPHEQPIEPTNTELDGSSPLSLIALLPPEERKRFLAQLSVKQKQMLRYKWRNWKARPNQLHRPGPRHDQRRR